MGISALDILNTLRDNASEMYMIRVPEATRTNLTQIGDAITSDHNIMNEFITTLINRIGLTNVINKMFKNPLAILKTAGVPNGSTIQEIFVNPATDLGYSRDGKKLLEQVKPDGKTAYYTMNRQSDYQVSIFKNDIKKAFVSEQAFMSFYNLQISSLYSGDNIDEFLLFKNLLGKTIDNGGMCVVESDIAKPKELAKAFSNMSSAFTYPSTKFAGYNLVNKSKLGTGDGKEHEAITFCEKKNQCLIIPSSVKNEINYEVLATLFHKEVAELEAMTIEVDEISSSKYDVYGILADRDSLQMRDDTFTMDSFYNGANMSWKFFLHHWEYQYISMFGNAVAFCKTKTTQPSEKASDK